MSDSTTAAGGCIFVVVDDGRVQSGKSNGRDFFFCLQIEGRTIIMSLRFLTAVQTFSSDGLDVHFFPGWWLRPWATDERVCYLPADTVNP